MWFRKYKERQEHVSQCFSKQVGYPKLLGIKQVKHEHVHPDFVVGYPFFWESENYFATTSHGIKCLNSSGGIACNHQPVRNGPEAMTRGWLDHCFLREKIEGTLTLRFYHQTIGLSVDSPLSQFLRMNCRVHFLPQKGRKGRHGAQLGNPGFFGWRGLSKSTDFFLGFSPGTEVSHNGTPNLGRSARVATAVIDYWDLSRQLRLSVFFS